MNDQSSRIYITYDTNETSLAPQKISIYASQPKHSFFYDSKVVPFDYLFVERLTLVIVKVNDDGIRKFNFFGFIKNITSSKDNVEYYVNNINSYPGKKVENVFYLDLPLNE